MNTCAVCGSRLEHVREHSDIPVGRGLATVELAIDRCVQCGEEFVDPEEYAAAQRRAAAVIREDLGLISPEEIRAIRERAGLTQGELEVLLGAGPKAVGRWERGTVLQSGMADKLLRVFEQYPGVLLELQRVQSGEVLKQQIRAARLTAPPAPEQQVTTTLHVHLGAGEGRAVDDQELELYAA